MLIISNLDAGADSPIAIVLTACGIETSGSTTAGLASRWFIAIVLTACGIETITHLLIPIFLFFELQ